MRWSEAGYLSQFVLTHALRQVSVSLILGVRQKKYMKRWKKLTVASLAVLAAVLVAPTAFSVITTRPKDALYPLPSIVCGCGFREYLIFSEDRGLWWNVGHNKKDEYYYTEAKGSGRLELYDWERRHVGWVEFHWLWIDIQMDGYPQTKMYRQLNWIQLFSEHRSGSKEQYRYETLEQKTEKIAEFRKKKSEEKENEPNKAVETTPVAVTPGADAPVAPSTSVSHL